MTRAPAPIRSQRGIALLESLIAFLVIAIAMFGILGLQTRTLVDTQDGLQRARAIRLIEDFGERLQNSPDALNNLATYTGDFAAGDAGTPGACENAGCLPAALAAADVQRWSAGLPAGWQAHVFIPTGGPRQLGIRLGWPEKAYQISFDDSNPDVGAPNAPPISEDDDETCPEGMSCHLQYVQPTQRCMPWAVGGGVLQCAGGN